MSSTLLAALQNSLLPFAATLLGGLAALWRAPTPLMRSAIQHFAAGVVFSAIAVELLPELVGTHASIPVMIGFIAGILLMLIVKSWTEKLSSFPRLSTERINPTGMIAIVAIDIFIDGLLIGIGYAAGESRGQMLSYALTLELGFLGLAAASGLAAATVARRKILLIVAGLAALVVAGIVIGFVTLSGVSRPVLAVLLAFGAAALLYLVTEELLVEAHEVPETPWLTGFFSWISGVFRVGNECRCID